MKLFHEISFDNGACMPKKTVWDVLQAWNLQAQKWNWRRPSLRNETYKRILSQECPVGQTRGARTQIPSAIFIWVFSAALTPVLAARNDPFKARLPWHKICIPSIDWPSRNPTVNLTQREPEPFKTGSVVRASFEDLKIYSALWRESVSFGKKHQAAWSGHSFI